MSIADLPTLSPAAGGHPIRLPVVRVQSRHTRAKILALDETELLMGWKLGTIEITEAMLERGSLSALRRACTSARVIRYSDMHGVWETIKRTSSKFTVITTDERRAQFSVPADQVSSVREALHSVLGERFWCSRGGPWLHLEQLSDAPLPSAAKRERPRRPKPAYAPVRGWTLKLLGVLYWTAIASPLTDGIAAALGTSGGAMYVWIALWLPAPILIQRGYQLCQKPMSRAREDDLRPPILFLRPFIDDASVTLQPPGMFAGLSGVRSTAVPHQQLSTSRAEGGRTPINDIVLGTNPAGLVRMLLDAATFSAEESIAHALKGYGPVVSVGSAAANTLSTGSARLYVEDSDWQPAVIALMREAQLIVVQPGTDPGIRWELTELRRQADPRRVLLSVASCWRNPQAFENIRRFFSSDLAIELPAIVPYLPQPVFVYFDANWSPVVQRISYKSPFLWPLTVDAVDLSRSLSSFLYGAFRGAFHPPQPPRWSDAASTTLVKLLAFPLAAFCAMAPILGMNIATNVAWKYATAVGPPADRLSVDRELLRSAAESQRTTLRGRNVAYSISVPEALLAVDQNHPAIEHFRRSVDGRLVLQVLASRQAEDLGDFAQNRLLANREGPITEVHLKAVRSVEHAGVRWVETEIVARTANGLDVQETARATSNDAGTVVVIIHRVVSPNSDATYVPLSRQIWGSFRLEPK